MSDCLLDARSCRVCLQRQETLFSLFGRQGGTSPYDKLARYTRLRAHQGDGGPASICSQCLLELDATVHFNHKVERSNRMLTKLIADGNCLTTDDSELRDSRVDTKEPLIYNSHEGIKESKYVSEKIVETEDSANGMEDVAQTEACDVEISQLECPECGSQRRCSHWAPPSKYTCQQCGRAFTRKFNLKLHVARHAGSRPWACVSCGAAQVSAGLARRHCVPRARRPCPAPGCTRSFTTAANLHAHLNTHTGERPFKCVECDKRFTSKNTLNDHKRIHTGVKPYICSVCGARFTTNKLSAHMRTHAGEGAAHAAHACPAPACTRVYSTARGLRDHTRAQHEPGGGRARHACSACPAQYAHAQSLNKHVRNHHSNNIQKPKDTVDVTIAPPALEENT